MFDRCERISRFNGWYSGHGLFPYVRFLWRVVRVFLSTGPDQPPRLPLDRIGELVGILDDIRQFRVIERLDEGLGFMESESQIRVLARESFEVIQGQGEARIRLGKTSQIFV